METLALIGVGLCSGLLGGMLGIGGGVVIVPALIFAYELSGMKAAADVTVIAVATSMSCIIFTSFSAAYTQYRAKKVKMDVVRRLVPFFVLGSLCAGLATPLFDPGLLRLLIGAFLLLVAIVMLRSWKPNPTRQFPGPVGSGATGLIGGFVSGTAGIAGGNVIVPTLLYFNTPVHNATATSSAMGVPIALAGAVGYALGSPAASSTWMLGLIDLQSWLAITVGAIIAAPAGVRIAHRVPADLLKKVFGAFLVLVSLRMLYSSAGLFG
ncbi:MAG: sulfite exporter TauE/SafE family protein [Pseudomonadales bacterium]|nr:sulfite exporter TauE/SafE family protein [Pseudomonadales bacterium]